MSGHLRGDDQPTLQQILIFLALTLITILAVMAWSRWNRRRGGGGGNGHQVLLAPVLVAVLLLPAACAPPTTGGGGQDGGGAGAGAATTPSLRGECDQKRELPADPPHKENEAIIWLEACIEKAYSPYTVHPEIRNMRGKTDFVPDHIDVAAGRWAHPVKVERNAVLSVQIEVVARTGSPDGYCRITDKGNRAADNALINRIAGKLSVTCGIVTKR